MAQQTHIEWCDSTFNPWIGCTRVSPACDDCYAARSTPARTLGVAWGAGQPRRRTGDANWRLPLQWNSKRFMQCDDCGWRGEAECELIGCGACGSLNINDARRRVFCASLADVFDNEVPAEWRAELFALIAGTPNLDWLLLTKRIGNVAKMIEAPGMQKCGLPSNIWLGATIVNQEEADRDIPKLLAVPAAKRFLSMEPLLEPVELNGHECSLALGLGEGRDWLTGRTSQHSSIFGGDTTPWLSRDIYDFPQDAREPRIHWVIVGGESGPKARPMHPDWARSLRDQCAAAGVPFLFKQWGEFLPTSANVYEPELADVPDSNLFWSDGSKWDRFGGQRAGVDLVARVGKKAAGRLLDGRTWDEFPT